MTTTGPAEPAVVGVNMRPWTIAELAENAKQLEDALQTFAEQADYTLHKSHARTRGHLESACTLFRLVKEQVEFEHRICQQRGEAQF